MSERLDLDKEQQELYDSWSKEEVYVAFVDVSLQSAAAQIEIKRLNKIIAGMEYDLKNVKDFKDD